MKALVKITALVIVAALTVGVAAAPAAAEPDMRQIAERLLEEQSNQAERPNQADESNQRGKRCVAGTAPAGYTPPGTCSSPYDPPPNIPPKCSIELVKIAVSIWVPPVIRWVSRLVGAVRRLVSGVAGTASAVYVFDNVYEQVKEVVAGYWQQGYDYVERYVCRNHGN